MILLCIYIYIYTYEGHSCLWCCFRPLRVALLGRGEVIMTTPTSGVSLRTAGIKGGGDGRHKGVFGRKVAVRERGVVGLERHSGDAHDVRSPGMLKKS